MRRKGTSFKYLNYYETCSNMPITNMAAYVGSLSVISRLFPQSRVLDKFFHCHIYTFLSLVNSLFLFAISLPISFFLVTGLSFFLPNTGAFKFSLNLVYLLY